jgi:monofunctional biosynthetic peptidoglycan transglycosylase
VSKYRSKSISGKLKAIIRNLTIILLGTPIIFVTLLKFIDPPIWGWKISRTFFPPHTYPRQIEHSWVPLNSISSNMVLAVVSAEDQTFPQHWGVDIHALTTVLSAAGKNGPIRGASTITQQTAKNVFLFPSQTYLRKAYELYIALLLEIIWGKERIMEVYLNVIEFGPGIYGVQAASQHYFGVSARGLTRYQAAQLAVVLPNPYKMRPTPMSNYVRQRTQWVLRQMKNIGTITL